ncbi:helix-turn-helix domain-containing protein [Streptomyces sp. SKN60]|uniref:helix-turn-helix domain-containing protein n=1 Tax=Streptomyces sp. SKN60 TaxID=2855506 RepID=UPI0022469A4F|nr:helix-turn-helix domain-containing protein [Streptomyces sp. SKN60]MCX2180598.1 helix-turn-helix domain-containing protein [Streptomyces sp. SKN60]
MVAEGGARTPRVGAAVRRRRRALDLTLAEVTARSGLSSPFLSQIENDRARPSMRSLQRIADALDTTAVRLLAASDESRTVDLVRAHDDSGLRGDALGRVRPVVRGRHQLHALEFTGEQEAHREYRHRNDELMYVADGGVEVEADGRIHRLGRGDSLLLSGGVRHRWRTTAPGTRVLVVAVAEHMEVLGP